MLTVLVADDEFAVLQVLSMALEAEGHRVLRAGDGADALRILSSQPCDVVVCDEVMPVMTGRNLIDAMRADPRLAEIPVILMIGVFGATGGASLEGVQVITKPVTLPKLFTMVAQAGEARGGPRNGRP